MECLVVGIYITSICFLTVILVNYYHELKESIKNENERIIELNKLIPKQQVIGKHLTLVDLKIKHKIPLRGFKE